jgi:hypothetical protein
MYKGIGQTMENQTTTTLQAVNVALIAYRPRGKKHPEQYMAKVGGRFVPVTPASARLVLDMSRNRENYLSAGLTRHPWRIGIADDGGRKWWGYEFLPNDLGRYLVEETQ